MITTNDEMQELELPDGLIERCMRAYGWSSNFANRALNGYRQFMKAKLEEKDWHATKLSPSAAVDQVWHQHILDVAQYVHACQSYAGHLIGHNPDGAMDDEALADRINGTITWLQYNGRNNNSVDYEIWSFGAHFEFAEVGSPVEATFLSTRTKTDKMETLFSQYAQKKGIPVETLEFRYVNSKVLPNDTPETVACHLWQHRFRIDVTRVNRRRLRDDDVAITIRVRDQMGEETLFKVKKGYQMCKVFATYAKKKGISQNSYRFLRVVGADMISPWTTPSELELDDQDRIDCMLTQGGC